MRTSFLLALALSSALATPALAQSSGYPTVQPTGPADQLASVMRRLATAPTDLQALISAGELSVKLDDMSAAAAFFARADKIDGRNGRVKAGMASILVRAERPGEALRYFQMAESYGLSAGRYAADRGLALDLVGEQERAQRDYRLALRTTPDDETVRRYALSLAISGKQQTALDQLEPLVRRQDRAAWRSRAFVLAMNGDVAGANKIAAAVMPAGMAAGLRPFLERLATLPASDRAFAVHFGEVRPTPARLADARMKPVFPALGPDPYAPVQVALAQTPPPVVTAGSRGRTPPPRRAEPRDRVQLASTRVRPATTTPTSRSVAATTPARTPPVALARAAPVRAAPPARVVAQPTTAATTSSASTRPASTLSTQTAAGGRPPALTPRPVAAQPAQVASVAATSLPGGSAPTAGLAPQPVQVASAASTPPVGVAPASTVPTLSATPSVRIAEAAPGFSTVGSSAPELAAASPAPAPATAVRSEDSILARIVASITVPGEELGVGEPARPAPVVAKVDAATERTLAAGKIKAARETADRAAAARTIAAAAKVKPAEAKPAVRGRIGAKSGTELAAAIPTRGKNKAGEEDAKPRTAAERRLAAKKDAEEKAAARTERGEPERIWVQVAGGANESDLPKAWTAAQKKAAALKGRTAYSTPLRATNRVVTGPFKTESEARAFVNQLARQGVSAFQFTSAAGQKMTKLPTQ